MPRVNVGENFRFKTCNFLQLSYFFHGFTKEKCGTSIHGTLFAGLFRTALVPIEETPHEYSSPPEESDVSDSTATGRDIEGRA
jgi:hypothetical protein